MRSLLATIARVPFSEFQSRHQLLLENLALRHQLTVLQRSVPRPKLKGGRLKLLSPPAKERPLPWAANPSPVRDDPRPIVPGPLVRRADRRSLPIRPIALRCSRRPRTDTNADAKGFSLPTGASGLKPGAPRLLWGPRGRLPSHHTLARPGAATDRRVCPETGQRRRIPRLKGRKAA